MKAFLGIFACLVSLAWSLPTWRAGAYYPQLKAPDKILGEDSTYLYYFKSDTNKDGTLKQAQIWKLDKDSLSLQVLPLSVRLSEKKKFTFSHIFWNKERLYLFLQENRDQQIYLWAQRYDHQAKQIGDFTLLHQLELSTNTKDFSYRWNNFTFAYQDFQKDSTIFYAYTLQENLQAFDHKRLVLKSAVNSYVRSVQSWQIDSTQNFWALSVEFAPFSPLSEPGQNPILHQLVDTVRNYQLDLGNNYMLSARFFPKQEGVDLLGLYSQDRTFSYTGTFFLQCLDGKITQANFTPLPVQLFIEENPFVVVPKGLSRYQAGAVVQKKQGGYYMLAEQKYAERVSRFNAFDQFYYYETYYHAMNALVTEISEQGVLAKAYLLPKKQISTDDETHLGFAFYPSQEENFLYLDHIKNKSISQAKKRPMTSLDQAQLVWVKRSEQGYFYSYPVFALLSAKLYPLVELAHATQKSWILPAVHRGGLHFIRIENP